MTKPGEKVVVKYTYEDYLQFPDDGKRYEIVDGSLFVTPTPGGGHQEIVLKLGAALLAHVQKRKLGKIFPAPFDVVLDKASVIQPDLTFVSTERLRRYDGQKMQGAPDLVVEILSPSTARRDRTLKLDTYARHGVVFYWIVDPTRRTLEEYHLEGERYDLVASLEARATFAPSLFPRLRIKLDQLWSD